MRTPARPSGGPRPHKAGAGGVGVVLMAKLPQTEDPVGERSRGRGERHPVNLLDASHPAQRTVISENTKH